MVLSKVFLADLQLLIASMSFGFGFAGQKEGMVEGIGPLTFNALRYMISTCLLAFVSIIPRKRMTLLMGSYKDSEKGKSVSKSTESEGRDDNLKDTPKHMIKHDDGGGSKEFNHTINVWFYGFALAILNFSGSTLQQTGIQYTSSSESAFLTGFYIVFTPLLQVLIPSISIGSKPKWNTWLAVSLAMLGLFIISQNQNVAVSVAGDGGETFTSMSLLGYGEFLTLIGAVFWTFHILLTDYATDRVDSMQLTLVQLFGKFEHYVRFDTYSVFVTLN